MKHYKYKGKVYDENEMFDKLINYNIYITYN